MKTEFTAEKEFEFPSGKAMLLFSKAVFCRNEKFKETKASKKTSKNKLLIRIVSPKLSYLKAEMGKLEKAFSMLIKTEKNLNEN